MESKEGNTQAKNNKVGQDKKTSFKVKMRRVKTKALASYYGNPAKKVKIICITGTTGKFIVARYVHEILKSANIKAAVLASDEALKTSVLHKFLSDAMKAGATYAVVTAPSTALESDAFYGLPIMVAALTNFIPAGLDDLTAKEYLDAKKILFKMGPSMVVLNADDAHYEEFKEFKGTSCNFTYGSDRNCDVVINNSTLYKKGAEANLSTGTKNFTVASFVEGKATVSYMACATAIATILKISPATIADGIANFEV